MTIRIFKCQSCGHKMRFSGRTCHACYRRKSSYQRPQMIWGSMIGVAVGASMLAVAVL